MTFQHLHLHLYRKLPKLVCVSKQLLTMPQHMNIHRLMYQQFNYILGGYLIYISVRFDEHIIL